MVLSATQLAAALGSGVGMAIVGGVAWAIIHRINFLFLLVIVGAGIGYFISEAISRASNKKRAPLLPLIAGVSAAASFFIGNVFFFMFWTDATASQALEQIGNLRISGMWGILSAVLATAFAVSRLRM